MTWNNNKQKQPIYELFPFFRVMILMWPSTNS